jgi:thiamine pyrophosphokinase
MPTRACIIANTPTFNSSCATARASEADIIIATDGAANRLPADVTPHIICGDFDSIDIADAQRRFPTSELIRSACQETNDLEKCIALALERGVTQIAISCALGGRIDQTVTTLSLLERYHREVSIILYEETLSCRVVSSDNQQDTILEIPAATGDTISLVPRGDGATVSLAAVRWPLTRELLTPGSRGVSNEALGSSVALTVHSGVVFLFHTPQR